MTSGVTANTGSPKRGAKPNGRIPDDENTTMSAKNLTASNSMDNLLSQFMKLSGQQLRAVFDRAVSEHNALVQEEKEHYQDLVNDNDAFFEDTQKQIDALHERLERLQTEQENATHNLSEQTNAHQIALENLDQRRALIENMMGLFKHKLDGFTD